MQIKGTLVVLANITAIFALSWIACELEYQS
jgi:hypothetical protein